MNIEVRIERLILDGFAVAPHRRPVLQAAVEAELARLLAEGGLASAWHSGGAVPRVAADSIQLTGQENPTQIGQQIAGAVYRGIGT
jgi:hypothetical protein